RAGGRSAARLDRGQGPGSHLAVVVGCRSARVDDLAGMATERGPGSPPGGARGRDLRRRTVHRPRAGAVARLPGDGRRRVLRPRPGDDRRRSPVRIERARQLFLRPVPEAQRPAPGVVGVPSSDNLPMETRFRLADLGALPSVSAPAGLRDARLMTLPNGLTVVLVPRPQFPSVTALLGFHG